MEDYERAVSRLFARKVNNEILKQLTGAVSDQKANPELESAATAKRARRAARNLKHAPTQGGIHGQGSEGTGTETQGGDH